MYDDGYALVAEYSGSTLLKRYVHGDQVDEPWGSTTVRVLPLPSAVTYTQIIRAVLSRTAIAQARW